MPNPIRQRQSPPISQSHRALSKPSAPHTKCKSRTSKDRQSLNVSTAAPDGNPRKPHDASLEMSSDRIEQSIKNHRTTDIGPQILPKRQGSRTAGRQKIKTGKRSARNEGFGDRSGAGEGNSAIETESERLETAGERGRRGKDKP